MTMAPKTSNVGIIGYGLSAKVFHIPLIQAVPELNLYAIVQRHPTLDNDASTDHPGIKAYKAAEELVQDPSVDIVVITTTPGTHFELTKLALEHGKHGMHHPIKDEIASTNHTQPDIHCTAIVEKPFVPTSQEADELIALSHKHHRLLSVYQ
ncbi:MAG: hypothetical protein L6R39_006369, partial [Caloplaca ligustica]